MALRVQPNDLSTMPESTGQRTGNARDTVLVVEDEPALRDLMALTLRRERLGVVTAKDGAEAIAQLAKHRFRVLVLDLMMPRVSGWDVIGWIRDHPDRRPHSVIVVTAADRNVFTELDPSVVNAIIVKPFDTYELAGYVRRCCDAPHVDDRRRKRIVGRA